MKKCKAMDIARYIINYAIKQSHPISNLQLQKIMYYIQAAFLVEKGEPIYEENILNWAYGPVIDEVYREFRIYGNTDIPNQDKYTEIVYDEEESKILMRNISFDDSIIEESSKELINKVTNSYINYSAFKLVNKTHSERPWKESKQNDVISIENIKDYYTKNTDKIYGIRD